MLFLVALLFLGASGPSPTSVAAQNELASGPLSIVKNVDAPATAAPGQRVVIHVVVSYNFSLFRVCISAVTCQVETGGGIEIGVSISATDSTSESLIARSRGGVVQPYGECCGERSYYLSMVMPLETGILRLTAHAFYSQGYGWKETPNSSKDFSISVQQSGYTTPSNTFFGDVTFRSQYVSETSTPAYADIQSISVTRTGETLTTTLTISGTTSDAQSNGMLYILGIDTTNRGNSVQNGTINFQVKILTNPNPSALLTTPDGSLLKTLSISTNSNQYVIGDLLLSDIGGYDSFSIVAVAYRILQGQISQVKCNGPGSGSALNLDVVEGQIPSLYTCSKTAGGTTSAFEWLARAPAGGWAPVSVQGPPASISTTTGVSVTETGSTTPPSTSPPVAVPLPLILAVLVGAAAVAFIAVRLRGGGRSKMSPRTRKKMFTGEPQSI